MGAYFVLLRGCLRYRLKGGGKVIKAHIVAMHLIVRAEIGKLVRNQRGTVYKIYIFIPVRQRFKVGIADYISAPFFPKPRCAQPIAVEKRHGKHYNRSVRAFFAVLAEKGGINRFKIIGAGAL